MSADHGMQYFGTEVIMMGVLLVPTWAGWRVLPRVPDASRSAVGVAAAAALIVGMVVAMSTTTWETARAALQGSMRAGYVLQLVMASDIAFAVARALAHRVASPVSLPCALAVTGRRRA